jgi:hypothetical protein
MKLAAQLIAATALAGSFAVSLAAPAFAIEPLAQQLDERNTYANPTPTGWTAGVMETRTHRAMHMQGSVWTPSTNVSPASMNSGLEQQR